MIFAWNARQEPMPLGLVLPPLNAPQPAQLEHMARLLGLHQALHAFYALLEPTTLVLEELKSVHHALLERMARALKPQQAQPVCSVLQAHTSLVQGPHKLKPA